MRRVLALCNDGRIEGTVCFSNLWAIPAGTEKPKDARKNSGNCINGAMVKARRKEVSISSNNILQEDLLFTSPSYAAMFVIGKSANGLTS